MHLYTHYPLDPLPKEDEEAGAPPVPDLNSYPWFVVLKLHVPMGQTNWLKGYGTAFEMNPYDAHTAFLDTVDQVVVLDPNLSPNTLTKEIWETEQYAWCQPLQGPRRHVIPY